MKQFVGLALLTLTHPSFTGAFHFSRANRLAGTSRPSDKSLIGASHDEVNDATNTQDSTTEVVLDSSDSKDDQSGSKSHNPNENYQSSLWKPLLSAAASTDRGQFASDEQKELVGNIITELESMTPSTEDFQAPTLSDVIIGTWELIYSDTQLFRSSPFFMAGRAVCKDGEEADRYDWFCDMHRAALAISEIGKVRQIITSEGRMISEFETNVGSIPFLSDFTPFKYSGGLPFVIEGAIVSSADITPTPDGKGWSILMDTVEIKGSNIPLLRQILDSGRATLKSRDLGSFLENNVDGYTNPRPIFETTYMDNMIRISRDQDGKVFVYAKASDVAEPTEYKSVESDLGILKLLEGVNDNFLKITL